jgi:hypothetical protein
LKIYVFLCSTREVKDWDYIFVYWFLFNKKGKFLGVGNFKINLLDSLFSVSERHSLDAVFWRCNFHYTCYVTTYLPFRREWRAMCAHLRLPYSLK